MLNDSMKKAMRVIDSTIAYYLKTEKRGVINVDLSDIYNYVSNFVRKDKFSATKRDFKSLFFLLQEYGYEYKQTYTTPTCYHGWIQEHRTMQFFLKSNPKQIVAFDFYPREKRIQEFND